MELWCVFQMRPLSTGKTLIGIYLEKAYAEKRAKEEKNRDGGTYIVQQWFAD